MGKNEMLGSLEIVGSTTYSELGHLMTVWSRGPQLAYTDHW